MFLLYLVKISNDFTTYSTASSIKSPQKVQLPHHRPRSSLTAVRKKTVHIIKANVRSFAPDSRPGEIETPGFYHMIA